MEMLGKRLCQLARYNSLHTDDLTLILGRHSKREATIRRGSAVATHLVESDKADVEFVATRIKARDAMHGLFARLPRVHALAHELHD